MDLLNVFTNKEGQFGTPLGIVEDLEKTIPEGKRLKIARDSGFTEVVFVESVNPPEIAVYTPEQRIPFASHALAGTYYYLVNKYKIMSNVITSMKNKINVSHKGGLYWAEAEISILPKFNLIEYPDDSTIDSFSLKNTKNFKHTLIWSWLDKNKGLVRAITFALDWGIPEDEANGSGSMLLSHELKRKITVFHGKGSVIETKPTYKNYVAVGGLVKQQFKTLTT